MVSRFGIPAGEGQRYCGGRLGNALDRVGPSWGQAIGIGVYLAVAILLFHGLCTQGGGIAGNPPDNEQHVWELGWWAFALTHGVNPFYTNYLTSAGHPIDLMWNNTVPLLSILAVPLTLLVGVVNSFNILFILVVWLVSGVTFICLRHLSGNAWGAWCGGLLFGFSPFALGNAGGGALPWCSLFLLPIMLVLFWRLLVRRRDSRWLLGLGIGVTASAQLLLSEELLLDAALVAVVMAVMMGVTYRDQAEAAIRYAIGPVLLAGGVCLAICGYPLFMQFAGPGHGVHGAVIPVGSIVSDLFSSVIPTPNQALSLGWLSAHLHAVSGTGPVPSAYLGIPVICLLIYMAVCQRSDQLTKWALVLIAVALIFSLGAHLYVLGVRTDIPLPWLLVRRLPLFSLAVPGRLMVFGYLGAALIVARFGKLSWPSLRRPWRLAIPTACLLSLLPVGAGPVTPLSTPTAFRSDSSHSTDLHGVLLVAPIGAGVGEASDASMIWQAEDHFRFRMPVGNIIQSSGPSGATTTPSSPLEVAFTEVAGGLRPRISEAGLQVMRDELQQWAVAAVVVGPTAHRERLVRLVDRLVGFGPTGDGGLQVWRLK